MAIRIMINPKEKNNVMLMEFLGIKSVKNIINAVSKYPRRRELLFLINWKMSDSNENKNTIKDMMGMLNLPI